MRFSPSASVCGIVASLLCFLPGSAAAENSGVPASPRFGRLGVEQGLSHTTVWDVLQDRSGFLWVGTETSLQRFDGYEMVDFRHDGQDPHSLSDSGVMVMHEDAAGILWFATRSHGVNRYDPAKETFERFALRGEKSLESAEEPSPMVSSLSSEAAGDLWIGTYSEGLMRLDPKSRRLESFRNLPEEPRSLASNAVAALFRDSQGKIWIGHALGVDRLMAESGKFEHFGLASPEEGVVALGEQDGKVWALSSASSLYFWQGGEFVRQATWPIAFDIGRSAPDGTFWFAAYGSGLYHFDPQRQTLTESRYSADDRESLSSDNVLSMRFDRAGLLWIGGRNGLSFYNPRRSQFEVARQGRGLPAASLGAILVDRRGEAWLSSLEGQLLSWRPGSEAQILATGLGAVDGLLETRAGVFWVGTGSGLYRLDREQRRLAKVEIQGLIPAINAIHEDPLGNLWLGGSGLARLDAAGKLLPLPPASEASPWPLGAVYAIAGDRDGRVWVGTNGGLYRMDPRTLASQVWHHRENDEEALPYEQVSDIFEDRQGRLWIGTYGGGLALFDKEHETFKRFGSREGLADDRVCGIVEDDEGRLWVSTNRGLSRFDADAWSAHNYDSADGLASDVFLIGARSKFADGRIVFGGHQGLTTFYPERITSDPTPPLVVLTELRVGGERMLPGAPGSPLRQSIVGTRAFELDFRQRSFALQFAAPHFANPKKNRFAYRLLGYEENWTETGAGDRRARYTNLDAGTYTFEVKASNEDGVWNEEGTRIEIAVLPAPWRTPWAYGLYAAVILGGFFLYSRWQEQRLERERAVREELARLNTELERLVEERTSEVKKLSGLLPICSSCRKIRDDDGQWQTLETYLNAVADVKLSHGICRDCARDLYPDIDIDQLAG